jgi:hypothetical protein
MQFFAFPEDARWNSERGTIEFTVVLGEYQGTVRVHRRVFQRMLDQSPTPERCLEAFHLQRTRSSWPWQGSGRRGVLQRNRQLTQVIG